MDYLKQFGAKPSKENIEQYAKSVAWKNNQFENLIETKMDMGPAQMPKLIKENIKNRKITKPQEPLEIATFNPKKWEALQEESFIWYGHSAAMFQLSNKTILVDPMLGPNAAPISPMPVHRFSEDTLDIIDDFPTIDAVFMTHDHYDHLDMKSIERLTSKVKHWYTALGVGRHLQKWGIAETNITELDWWETGDLGDIHFTFTPSRHFSGRGLKDRAKSLWGGWVFESPTSKVYWSGDGGYGPHFKEVGQKLGPFDLMFVECGQYNLLWHAIHLLPEESVQAAIDAKAKVAIPVHWGGFSLALHHWKEPVEVFTQTAQDQDLNYSVPRLGEIYPIKGMLEEKRWWESLQ